MPGINTRPAAVEIYWKYRHESIQTARLGTRLDKPNIDSDEILEGIQNSGLIDVTFIPTDETIDLYYRPINAAGRGPAVNIIPTGLEFTLNNMIPVRGDSAQLIGPIASLSSLQLGDMLRIDNEIVTIATITRLLSATLNDGLIAFWPLSERGDVRENIYGRYGMSAFSDINPVGFAAGPQAGQSAALFTGTEALRTPYDSALSAGRATATGFTISCWVYPTLADARSSVIVSRRGTRREFQLNFDVQGFQGIGEFSFRTFDPSGTAGSITWNALSNPDSWYFVIAWFDPTTRQVQMSVNNAPVQSSPYANSVADTGVEMLLGARLVEVSSTDISIRNNFRGRIANVGYWHRLLTSTERDQLFNSFSVSSSPRVDVGFVDRGAHGTEPTPHDANAPVVKMRSTVPTNSIVMDELSDETVPGAPESLRCAASGDGVEIGIEVVIHPPVIARKTIKRIQIQASEAPLWPTTLIHTLGVRNILDGPHTGVVRYGQKVLISDFPLAAGLAQPYTLYTYTSVDVDTGVIVDPFIYSITEIMGNEITIEETFNVNEGKTNDPQQVNFIVFRGWLDAPVDYVVNDTPIVTPPAGDIYSHEPFQKFYKTAKDVYVRARYYNRRGTGPWIYWDDVVRNADLMYYGSENRAEAVIFSPLGIAFAQIPDEAPPSAPIVIVESIGLNVFINIAPIGAFTNYTEFRFYTVEIFLDAARTMSFLNFNTVEQVAIVRDKTATITFQVPASGTYYYTITPNNFFGAGDKTENSFFVSGIAGNA